MRVQDIVSKFSECFKQKCLEFCELKGLTPEGEATPDECGSIVSMIWDGVSEAGTTAMKEYVESCDIRPGKIIVDGMGACFKDTVDREFHVGFGVATIRRRMFQPVNGGECFAPLDALFNVVDEYAFPDIRKTILHASATMTPEEIVETLADFHVPPMSATAVKRIILETGRRLEALRPKIEAATSLSTRLPEGVKACVASMDGTTVPVRHPKEAGLKYKVEFNMAMAGTVGVYGAPHVCEDGRVRMDRLSSAAFARMPEEKYPVFKDVFDREVSLVLQALPDDVPKILLLDGAVHQWLHVDGIRMYDDFFKLIDFYHMKEHLVAASTFLFGVDAASGRTWTGKWEKTLLEEEDSAGGVHRSIEYHLRKRRLSKTRRQEVEKHLTYFRNNHKRMNYAWFVKRGLPIGSGPVESCCKVLIKGRLCQSGMSWKIHGGQAVLTLRAHRKYGDWERMWNAYMKLQNATYPEWRAAA